MSMYSTKMSLGRCSGTGEKLIRLLTPARTSVSARLLSGISRYGEHGDLDAEIAYQGLHAVDVEAAHAVDDGTVSAGSTSKAATIATEELLSSK